MHFPLHTDTPTEGLSLEALFEGQGKDLPEMKARMTRLMAEEGLPYGDRSHTYNSRLAQEMAKWGEAELESRAGSPEEAQTLAQGMHKALFQAYFVDGLNIAEADVLAGVAAKAGLDPDEARRVVAERRFSDAVDDDWAMARSVGVAGVPTFAMGGYGVVGAQPYEALDKFVRQMLEGGEPD